MAKLSQHVGLDFWHQKSRYGGTIETAIKFLMKVDPKGEDVSESGAAVATAYGVYGGREYQNYLAMKVTSYQSQAYWLYDQPEALQPKSARTHSFDVPAQEDTLDDRPLGGSELGDCPFVFKDMESCEIENGIYVTCEDIRKYLFEWSP